MCVVSQDKECGRAIMATEKLTKENREILNENKKDFLKLTRTVDGLVISVNKLVIQHEEEEKDIVTKLKERLHDKDTELKERDEEIKDSKIKKEELADIRRWQIKLAVFIAFLGFISASIMYAIN